MSTNYNVPAETFTKIVFVGRSCPLEVQTQVVDDLKLDPKGSYLQFIDGVEELKLDRGHVISCGCYICNMLVHCYGDGPQEAVYCVFVYDDDEPLEDDGTQWGARATVAAVVVTEEVLASSNTASWRLLNAIRECQRELGWPEAELYVLRPSGKLEVC